MCRLTERFACGYTVRLCVGILEAHTRLNKC